MRTKQTARWIAAILLYYSGIFALYNRFRQRGVLIFCYHRISEGSRDVLEMSTPRTFFDRQLSLLARRRPILSLRGYLDSLEEGRDSGAAAVVTFDDGYADNLSLALPVLQTHGVTASFFLTASLIGSKKNLWYDRIKGIVLAAGEPLPGRIRLRSGKGVLAPDTSNGPPGLIDSFVASCKTLDHRSRDAAIGSLAEELGVAESFREEDRLLTWKEAKAIAVEGGEIGSHGCSHTTLSAAADAEGEIVDSRRILEERLGIGIRSFAYPNGKAGDFDSPAVEALRRAGYHCGLTTIEGENFPGCDPFTLKRKCLGCDDSATPFGSFSRALFLCEAEGLFRALSWWKGRSLPAPLAGLFRRTMRLFRRTVEYTIAEADLSELDPSDLERLISGSTVSFGEISPSDLEGIGAAFGRKKAAEFARRLPRSRGFLASLDGKAVAYNWYTDAPRSREGDPPFLVPIIPRKGTVYLYDAYVSPSHRGSGVATGLMAYRLSRALEAGAAKALLIYSHPAIRQITWRFGFRDIGQLRYRRVLFGVHRDVEDLGLVNADR